MKCPLCHSLNTAHFSRRHDNRYGERDYFLCQDCQLVFMDPAQHFDPIEEKERYDTHQNDPQDPQYLDFLNRLAQPMRVRITVNSIGLDVGSGPGPAMHHLFKEHTLKHYDPFYAPDKTLLNAQYDFVTCSETAEHFCNPRKEFQLLHGLLKKDAWLGVMTYMRDESTDFDQWWYPRDLTHVSFYHHQTFEWIAVWLNLCVEFPAENIVLFHRR